MPDIGEKIEGLEYENQKILKATKKMRDEISDLRHLIAKIEGKVNMDLNDMKKQIDDVTDSLARFKRKLSGSDDPE